MRQSTVVVVDNDSSVLQLMEEILDGEGYAVSSLLDKHTGFFQVQHAQPDLVILELRRADPDRTLILLNQLRQHPATKDVPIIINSTDRQLLNSLAEPLHYFGCALVEKPFSLDQFIDTVADKLCSYQVVDN